MNTTVSAETLAKIATRKAMMNQIELDYLANTFAQFEEFARKSTTFSNINTIMATHRLLLEMSILNYLRATCPKRSHQLEELKDIMELFSNEAYARLKEMIVDDQPFCKEDGTPYFQTPVVPEPSA